MLAATVFDLFLSGLIILTAVGIAVLIARVIIVSRQLARTPSWRLHQMDMEDAFSPDELALIREPSSDGRIDALIARHEAARGHSRNVPASR